VAEQIDDEVHIIIQQAYEVAKGILTENKPRLIHIAKELIARETLESEALDKLFTEPLPQPETTTAS
jgi:cell division protease FtsH